MIGYSGQLSLGHSAFVGLGAYTTIILVADHHWSYFATIPVSAALCFVVGLIVGLPALRISGLYLAIVTLSVAFVFPTLVLKYDWLTGGPNGKKPPRGEGKLVAAVVDAVRRRRPAGRPAVGVLHPAGHGGRPVPAGPQLRQEPVRAGRSIAVRDNQTSAAVERRQPADVQGRWRSASARRSAGSPARC